MSQVFTAHDGHPVPAVEFFSHHARMLGRPRVPTAPAPLVRLGGGMLELRSRVTGESPPAGRDAAVFMSRRAAYPNERARRLLGWEPEVPLAEGMRRAEAWARAEGLLS